MFGKSRLKSSPGRLRAALGAARAGNHWKVLSKFFQCSENGGSPRSHVKAEIADFVDQSFARVHEFECYGRELAPCTITAP